MSNPTEGELAIMRDMARVVIQEYRNEMDERTNQKITLHLLTCPTTIKVNRMCWTTAGAVCMVLVLYRVALAFLGP